GAKRHIFRYVCQAFFDKKWGILIKKESTSLVNRGLEIPRDYNIQKEVFALYTYIMIK
ncbi:hypothetical protein M2150_002466, partial [Lachnospiraceae bacterium PM6-15]